MMFNPLKYGAQKGGETVGMMWGSGYGMGSGGFSGGKHPWQLRELAQQERFDGKIVHRALLAFVPYWRKASIISTVLILTAMGGSLPAWLSQQMINRGILAGNLHILFLYATILVLVAILTGLLGVVQAWLSNAIAQDVMADYRLKLFEHIQKQTLYFFTTHSSGDLISRVMNDVTAIQSAITTTLLGLLSNLFIIATTLALMFTMNWKMALLSLLVVPGFVLPTQKVGRRRQGLQAKIQERLSSLTVQLSEQFGVSGALLIRIFGLEVRSTEHFQQVNQELRTLQVQQTLTGRWLFMWLGMFSSIGPALLWAYGGWLAIHHQLSLGTIVAFTALLSRLYGPLSQLAQIHVGILASIALFRRIFALLDVSPMVEDGHQSLPEHELFGRIQFKGVNFAYPKERPFSPPTAQTEKSPNPPWVLRGIDLTLTAGQLTALVGPSGAGKTSLIHLILRFADPQQGCIELDGHNLRDLTLVSLRQHMGMVPQDPFFFHDTVRNNLAFANPHATLTDMVAACTSAQIHDTLAALPYGYDTVVGERGYRLSGGERQRLAIARVLLKSPRIVLLDEATSALDTLVERKIQVALLDMLRNRTAVVIAHRLSTILAADKIVVMNQGVLVAEGTHHELLSQCSLYRELYDAQFAVQQDVQTPLVYSPWETSEDPNHG